MTATRVIYVAGPYSARTAYGRECNIRRAEAVALELWRARVPAICVHTTARYFFGDVEESIALACDLAILDRCDAVMLVDGWPHSNGTIGEMRHALAREKPIFAADAIDACIRWAHGGTDLGPNDLVEPGWWSRGPVAAKVPTA